MALLDEPLSALDLTLRQHMRAELKAIQRRTGVTLIYITHDQGEALTMSNRFAPRVERIDMEGPYLIAHLRAGDAAAALHAPNLAGAAAGLTGAVEAAFRPEDAAAFRPGGLARG